MVMVLFRISYGGFSILFSFIHLPGVLVYTRLGCGAVYGLDLFEEFGLLIFDFLSDGEVRFWLAGWLWVWVSDIVGC